MNETRIALVTGGIGGIGSSRSGSWHVDGLAGGASGCRAGRRAGGEGRLVSSMSTLFEFLPIGAYRTSPSGEVLRANAALVRMNGFDNEAEWLAFSPDATPRK